ncbi:hypothetical protein Thiowin_01817 [Thiorhodovibrio winogradskyi]|uniref:ABC transporter substrate-binding protein n=1 Tax=Thiorhodovibrio winogradskyi TaxID=77007 RepID=A0ABZ0S9W0_9GAMM|nr:hypothetical protein [Thiorhodovibrio winogradskyi]
MQAALQVQECESHEIRKTGKHSLLVLASLPFSWCRQNGQKEPNDCIQPTLAPARAADAGVSETKGEKDMSNLFNEYDEIKVYAEDLHYALCDLCEKDDEINYLYLGSQILFSDLIENPRLLIIGSNPGPGYFNDTRRRVEEFEPLGCLQYMDRDRQGRFLWGIRNQYAIAETTRRCFEDADLIDILENSVVKTNLFYPATRNGELSKLIDCARSYGIDINENISRSEDLILAINPDVILVEGSFARDNLPGLQIDRSISTKDTQRGRYKGIPTIAYARWQRSDARNPEELTYTLKEVFDAC